MNELKSTTQGREQIDLKSEQTPPFNLFATAPIALAPLLAVELSELGASRVRILGAGVSFGADLSMAYRVCLWSRLASRVLLPIGEAAASDGEQLYQGAREID